MSGVYITVPNVSTATVTPMITTTGALVTITVAVSEIEKYLPPVWFYAGETYAGSE